MCKKILKLSKILTTMTLIAGLVFATRTTMEASAIEEKVSYAGNVQQERSLLDEVNSVSDSESVRTRSLHLNMGSVELMKLKPTRALIGATTQAHHVCDEVTLELYVDRYNSDTETWEQWRHWTYTEQNVDNVTRELEFIVRSGYYYSVRGYHSCKQDNVLEYLTTETDGLYIGLTDKP